MIFHVVSIYIICYMYINCKHVYIYIYVPIVTFNLIVIRRSEAPNGQPLDLGIPDPRSSEPRSCEVESYSTPFWRFCGWDLMGYS